MAAVAAAEMTGFLTVGPVEGVASEATTRTAIPAETVASAAVAVAAGFCRKRVGHGLLVRWNFPHERIPTGGAPFSEQFGMRVFG
jgi:hypothetical protein